LVIGEADVVEGFVGEVLPVVAVHAACLGTEKVHAINLQIAHPVVLAIQKAVKSAPAAGERALEGRQGIGYPIERGGGIAVRLGEEPTVRGDGAELSADRCRV